MTTKINRDEPIRSTKMLKPSGQKLMKSWKQDEEATIHNDYAKRSSPLTEIGTIRFRVLSKERQVKEKHDIVYCVCHFSCFTLSLGVLIEQLVCYIVVNS